MQLLGCDKDSFFILDDSVDFIEAELKDKVHNDVPVTRVVTGAHEEEIVTIQYSRELSLIATGTIGGELAVWDYEQSRLIDIAIGHFQSEITGIHFLWPYPLMLTTSMDGQIIIWVVRTVGEDSTPVRCLYKFRNDSYDQIFKKT